MRQNIHTLHTKDLKKRRTESAKSERVGKFMLLIIRSVRNQSKTLRSTQVQSEVSTNDPKFNHQTPLEVRCLPLPLILEKSNVKLPQKLGI